MALPSSFFCSSEVYELHINKNGEKELRIHAENCMHCKTCDIKSPEDGVTWVVPNGGNGPDFQKYVTFKETVTMPLTIISLIKQVPLPSEMRMGEDGLMDRTKAKSIINIDCQFGLEAGLQLRKQNPDARLIVCSHGTRFLRKFAKDSDFNGI